MADPFRALRSNAPILTNRTILSPDYQPSELPARETDADRLALILYPLLESQAPQNTLITGPSGCGKTALARHVLHALELNATEIGKPVPCVVVDAQECNTHYRMLARIANRLDHANGHVPFTGWPTKDAHDAVAQRVNQHGRALVFVDHFERLIEHAGEEPIHDLASIPGLTLLASARSEQAIREHAPQAHKLLAQRHIELVPYSTEEVRVILERRAAAGLREAPSPEALDVIATESHGDARRALAHLLEAAEYAAWNGKTLITALDARTASSRVEREAIKNAIRDATMQERVVLEAARDQTRASLDGSATSGDIYRAYANLARQRGLGVLTHRRVTSLLDDWAARSLLAGRVVSYGRLGRTKEVRMIANANSIDHSLAEA